jgi:hypothetical protein
MPPPLLLLLLLLSTTTAHLPFSHHRLFPGLTRAAGGPMPFSPVAIPAGDSPEAAAARPKYAMAHQPPLAAFEYPAGEQRGLLRLWAVLRDS